MVAALEDGAGRPALGRRLESSTRGRGRDAPGSARRAAGAPETLRARYSSAATAAAAPCAAGSGRVRRLDVRAALAGRRRGRRPAAREGAAPAFVGDRSGPSPCRCRRAAPLGVDAPSGRGPGAVSRAGAHPRADRAVDHRRAGRGRARRRLHLPRPHRPALARRPRVARGRRCARDAAVRGPGLPLGRARRPQPGVEARCRPARRPRAAARQLRGRAAAALPKMQNFAVRWGGVVQTAGPRSGGCATGTIAALDRTGALDWLQQHAKPLPTTAAGAFATRPHHSRSAAPVGSLFPQPVIDGSSSTSGSGRGWAAVSSAPEASARRDAAGLRVLDGRTSRGSPSISTGRCCAPTVRLRLRRSTRAAPRGGGRAAGRRRPGQRPDCPRGGGGMIAVLGATGTIGQHVAAGLAERLLMRARSSATRAQRGPLPGVPGDLTRPGRCAQRWRAPSSSSPDSSRTRPGPAGSGGA